MYDPKALEGVGDISVLGPESLSSEVKRLLIEREGSGGLLLNPMDRCQAVMAG